MWKVMEGGLIELPGVEEAEPKFLLLFVLRLIDGRAVCLNFNTKLKTLEQTSYMYLVGRPDLSLCVINPKSSCSRRL